MNNIGFREITFGLRMLRVKIPIDWQVVKISEITETIVPGRNKPTAFEGDIPWITIADIDGPFTAASKLGLNLTEQEVRRTGNKIIPVNSVIMTCVGELGIVSITTNRVVINQQLHAFVCTHKVLPYFLANSLKFWKKYMYSIATTTTIAYMNKASCESIPIILPPIEEQQKIASILSKADDLIRKTNEIIEQKQRLKKGLMQRLLTRGIGHRDFKTVRLFPRFTHETIPKDWSVSEIANLVDIIDYRGRTPPFSEKGIVHLRSNNVREGSLNFDDVTYVSEDTYVEYMTRGIPRESDLLFTTEGPLGEVALVPANLRFSLAQRIILLRPRNGSILPEFLKYMLSDKKVRTRYFGLATGTTLGGIASKWFKRIVLPYPTDVREQKLIANILGNIEVSIQKDKELLSHYSIIRTGLLQKLLTGQIRVKI